MDDLLFLAHRIPYPPRKGDKIRSYHLLRLLSQRYRVHLGAFVDDANDLPHATTLARMCGGETRFIRLHPLLARVRALQGLLTGSSLTLPYYNHRAMGQWTRDLLRRHPITRIVVYSAAPAQFVLHDVNPAIRRVIDFVDVDSLKWDQYASGRRGLSRWIYRREARTLLADEKRIAAAFDAALFVSEPEANLFKTLAPETSGKIDFWENGVDVDFFSPHGNHENPFDQGDRPLVFTGAMDYWANVDAVTWFATTVFPTVLAQIPRARFVIVGGRPAREVLALQRMPGITVTGKVPDVRPFIAWSKAAVAPMRIAQGIQNKVLEAMAMARPVLATPKAMEGIRIPDPMLRWVGDEAQTLATLAIDLLNGADEDGSQPPCGPLGREHVLTHHNWSITLEKAAALVAG
ncbi:MAG: TIGR03087 family PEP-CTERM/XrtA system glycosyltransferase [Magnetococcales bacterium]|nr:TIGR03087 family PEP-CTERM/XrtA system glycosyltransferase [Magnetococcales bacterium]